MIFVSELASWVRNNDQDAPAELKDFVLYVILKIALVGPIVVLEVQDVSTKYNAMKMYACACVGTCDIFTLV